MRDPANVRIAETHEWLRLTDRTAVIGITDYAQARLGDITHVDLPEPDEHHYEAGDDLGIIESLKTSIDFHAPVAGVVSKINTELLSRPELINSDTYGSGWLVELAPDRADDIDELLDIDEYEAGLPEDEDDEGHGQ